MVLSRANIRFLPMSLLNFVFVCFLFDATATLSAYDITVLQQSPVAYWSLDPNDANDYSGHNLNGIFTNNPSAATMPNNDTASLFNGLNQYFTIADNDYLEIVRTGILTIQAWFRPDALQFNRSEGSGYVWWMGKGDLNQQSWAARMYNYNNTEGRPNRISGYAFNLTGGLGAGSYFQDIVTVGTWIFYSLTINTVHVNSTYPTGYIKIFKNGIERDLDSLIGYGVIPQNSTAPMRVGTRQMQSFFQGAIGKVAVFDYELNSSQIQRSYNCMIMNTNCSNISLPLNITHLNNSCDKLRSTTIRIFFWITGTLFAKISNY